jgi:hypothetical protein
MIAMESKPQGEQTETIDGLKSDDDLWNSIKWSEVNQIVDCLQRRIVKAVKQLLPGA